MPPTPSSTPAVPSESQSPNNSNIIVAVFAALGGFTIVVILVAAFVVLRRRRSTSQDSAFGHRHTQSDSSSASLLDPHLYWKADPSSASLFYPSFPPGEPTRRKESIESIATIKPMQDGKPETSPDDAMRDIWQESPPHRPFLTPLCLPQRPSIISFPPNNSYRVESPTSDHDSESMYSQPSAASHSITPRSGSPPSSPRLLPPMVPQYAHVRTDTADVPTRADTRVIRKLLKKRAKQNQGKLTRSTSGIERADFIQPFLAEDSDGDDESLESVHRSARHHGSRTAPVSTIEESDTVEGRRMQDFR